MDRRLLRRLALVMLLTGAWSFEAHAQTSTPAPAPSQAAPPSVTPAPVTPAPTTPDTKTPDTKTPVSPPPVVKTPGAPGEPDTKTPDSKTLAPGGKPDTTEIERNRTPSVPDNATTENVTVPARPIIMTTGQSSYDDAFKSLKASLDKVKAAMDKAGLKPSGHPITIFSEPDDKGFKYQAGVPVATKPEGKTDFGDGVVVGVSPTGKAIKFQHRGAYDDIDSTYDVITAYLDAKGMQVDNPYIEEYLTELTTPDDPNLQVDIYVFVKP